MAESRRRLSPDDRRNELLTLGAEVFGQRPYDEVRIDEIAERAGVSRALMYHYFPDKRTFFAAVVRAEGERLFEATNTPPDSRQTLFDQVREGVLAYVRYDEEHPHGAWAAYIGMGRSDPVLRGIEDIDNDRQANRILGRIADAVGGDDGLQGRTRSAGHDLRLAGIHLRDVSAATHRPLDRRRIPCGCLCACPARRGRAGARYSRRAGRSRRSRASLIFVGARWHDG